MPDRLAQARTDTTYSEQFKESGAETELLPGFVRFHQQNFSKYFGFAAEDFKGKLALETGAGPGKHAAVLHLLGARVIAVDLLESNIKAIERLARAHGFSQLQAYQRDLMQPLPAEWPAFDLISSHNWLQHAEDPGAVLRHLIAKLKPDGRLYVSVYGAGTFRLFISQIARAVLRWDDREALKTLIPFAFPEGFLEFKNPDHIYFENILDDFFVPSMWTFRQESLTRFLRQLGCEVLVPHAGRSRLYEIDQEYIRMGFKKTSEPAPEPAALEYRHDEWDVSGIQDEGARRVIGESVAWAGRCVERLRAAGDGDAWARAAFCLGLYRIRAAFSRATGAKERHEALQAYLRRVATGETKDIRSYASSTRHYAKAVHV